MDTLLSDTQKRCLAALCEAFIPSFQGAKEHAAFWLSSSRQRGIEEKFEQALASFNPDEKAEFIGMLDLLESPISGLTAFSPLRRFRDLDSVQKEKFLLSWSASRLPKLRKGFQTMKKLVSFLYYGSGEDAKDPVWAAMAYPGPVPVEKEHPRKLNVIRVTQNETQIDCDVVIAGSGAGGGLAALLLAMKGKDVIVVEKGSIRTSEDFSGKEAESVANLYEKRGLMTSADGALTVFAGSTLGGGTAVNWTAALRTPDSVLEEWSRLHGNSHFTSAEYSKNLDWVHDYFRVNTDNGFPNPQNQALFRGSQALGHHVYEIPRNVEGCFRSRGKHCGWCGFGCREMHKRGTMETAIPEACSFGARILPDTQVLHLRQNQSAAEGVECLHRAEDGSMYRVTIRARKVVLAAGALHTPVILMKSGYRHAELGRNLFVHPVSGVAGVYESRMEPWSGVMMSALNDAFAGLHEGYGVRIETPPAHPGMMAMTLPWQGAKAHKRQMLRAAHMGLFIALTRDKFGGHVSVGRDGLPVIHYRLHPYDRKHLLSGLEAAMDLHFAAGAKEVLLAHEQAPLLDAGMPAARRKQLLHALKWKPNAFGLFSAHQMGTCRMGGDPARYPVNPEGAVNGLKNVYVADASLMPSACGVNPMMTIWGLARWVAGNMK